MTNWYKFDESSGTTAANASGSVSNGTVHGGTSWVNGYSGNGNIRFAIKNNGSSEQIIDGQSTLATDGWHHVDVTLNGSTGTLYVDGVQVGSNTSMIIKPSNMGATTHNWIGRSQYSADPYLNGRVDDFRLYSRVLSAADIAALAASSS
jgi:hypothetical protein